MLITAHLHFSDPLTVTMYMSKVGPIWHSSVLCLLAPGDTIPKPSFLLHLVTSKNAGKCQFSCALKTMFSVFGAKKNPIKMGQRVFCQIGPCLPPPHGDHCLEGFLAICVCGQVCASQEPLNAPFLNGLFSSGFPRGENGPLRPLETAYYYRCSRNDYRIHLFWVQNQNL